MSIRSPFGGSDGGDVVVCFPPPFPPPPNVGTDRIRFWRARFQKPSSLSLFVLTEFREESSVIGKSHTSVEGNFRRRFRTIGPYEFSQEEVWTNGAQSSLKVSVCAGIGP